MKAQKFISKYNYSIELPSNWSEYEIDEDGTDAFFNTEEWTGNLRITRFNYLIQNPEEYINKEIAESDAEKLEWNGIIGLNNSGLDKEEYFYSWQLVENNCLYLCSFTIDSKFLNTEKHKSELDKVISILKSIKTIKK